MDIKLNDASAVALLAPPSPDVASLLHALQAHQAELEAQNLELQRTQQELAAALDRYRDLYDHAPVGYLTLDRRGRILAANASAARLLAQPQDGLASRPLSAFMAPQDADRWHLQLRHAFEDAAPWRIELSFQQPDGVGFAGQLNGLRAERKDGAATLRVTLTDVTVHRHADADRRAALQVMAGQEADRLRVARELHDDLGQRLSALKMTLAAKAVGGLPDADLCQVLGVLDEAVASVRRLAADLRPLMLDDLGLGAAVEALARHAARQYGLQIALRLDATDPPPGDPASVTLYRLLQACLPLLASQPGLHRMTIELHEATELRLLTVQSHARRAAPGRSAAVDPGRWTVLREAAHLMGCTLDVAPARHGGERITLGMPLPETGGPVAADAMPIAP